MKTVASVQNVLIPFSEQALASTAGERSEFVPFTASVEQISLTIYLIRSDQVQACERELLSADSIPLLQPLDGVFIPLRAREAEPRWAFAVRSILQTQQSDLSFPTQSPAGLLLLRHAGKLFIVSFGHAWLKLKDDWLERDFGRRAALNSMERDQIVEIRAEQVFAKWHVANDRAPRATSVEEFSVDFDRDLVGRVEGVPSHRVFGQSIRGGTSLHVTVPFADLPAVLEMADSLFASHRYREIWPEIETISPVHDKAKQAALESHLDQELASGQAQKNMALFTPASKRENAEPANAFVFGRFSASAVRSPYLNFESWLNFLRRNDREPSVSSAKDSPVHLLDDCGQRIKTYRAFDCFGYELPLDGRQYVLSSGQWYEATPEFVSRINRTVAAIKVPSIHIPDWNQSDDEKTYNLAAVKSGFLHFDAKNLYFGGRQSKFEWCDLVHQDSRTLVFVKIVSKSSGMSHLVEQVRRTVELFFSTDPSYRQQLRGVFATHYPEIDCEWLDHRPQNGEWNLCLASLGRPALDLPFFARCALARVYRDLTERGHAVSFAGI